MFEGLERDGELLVDPDDIRDQYIAEITAHFSQVARECRETDIEYRRILTTTALDTVLLDFLYQRLARRKGAGARR